MLDPNNIDFKKLGFHAGIEVHHQIKSDRKLFCNCPAVLEDDPHNSDYRFYRYFRPVLGEMGDYDPGMLVEFEKGYKVFYNACERNTCTYEFDETPPFPPDPEAIKKGFYLSFYFNCSALAEEVVVNRKQYLDGSITTGFQRTFIIGRDGWVPVFGKKVGISNVHIEEDSARRVDWIDTSNRTVTYSLDRLGVPLTEVISRHEDVDSPEELIELALQIGRVLRISQIGRRGKGTARQDVNISITGGDRVELKGVQELDMFDIMCRHEVVRQVALLEIKDMMLNRGIKKEDFEHTYIDISHLFTLENDEKVYVVPFPNMKGIFGVEVQPCKDFGEDIFEKSMLITGIPRSNHYHSDELADDAIRKKSYFPSTFNLTLDLHNEICSTLNLKENDAYVFVQGQEKQVLHALKKIVERVKMGLEGVPQETRRFLPSGNSEFLRVIHGKERIYPDTDTPPIVIPLEDIQKWKKEIGKRPWEIQEELSTKYGYSQKQIDLLIRDESIDRLYQFTEKLGIGAKLAFKLLIELPRSLRRKGIYINTKVIDYTADAIANKNIVPEQIHSFIEFFIANRSLSPQDALKKLETKKLSDEEIEKIISDNLTLFDSKKLQEDEKYRTRAFSRITHAVLSSTNYSLSGKIIVNRIQNLLNR